MYLCLALGLQGPYRVIDGGRSQLEALREPLQALRQQQRAPIEPALSIHWEGAIGGVGRTRNRDWWFCGNAVLLDTAGRYTTQDSHTDANKAPWDGFLRLLRRYRRRRRINGVIVNGVIVALSAADLLREDEAYLHVQSRHPERLRPIWRFGIAEGSWRASMGRRDDAERRLGRAAFPTEAGCPGNDCNAFARLAAPSITSVR